MTLLLALLLTVTPANPWGWDDGYNTDAEWRSFWAHRLYDMREVMPDDGAVPHSERPHTTVGGAQQLGTTSDSPASVPLVATTTTTVPHPCTRHTLDDHKPGTLEVCPLISPWFNPPDLEWALDIVDCESNGIPSARNPNGGAGGLFQVMPGWEATMLEVVGSSDRFDPTVNARFAAWLYYHGGGPSHWVCKA